MTTLSTILRRALSMPMPLRLGTLHWLAPDRLCCCLHEPGELQSCAEIEVHFLVTGERDCEVVATLVDIEGSDDAAAWFDAHEADGFLLDLWDEHLAAHPTCAEVAA